MRVALLMPVARKDRGDAAVARWAAQGYEPFVFQNEGADRVSNAKVYLGEYKGVWDAINQLAHHAINAGVDVCVYAGDDMDPDPNRTATEIGHEYRDRFRDGFGVMQPCGDMQGIDRTGKPAARRIAGSAWFGEGWVKRSYQGQGPTWAGYWHFYADEELPMVAEIYGCMWWRPDLTQYHHHWSWGHMPRQDYHVANQKHWHQDKAVFEARKKAGFPQKEPLPVYDRPGRVG